MKSHPASQGLSLRISVTDRCQLRCGYCMPPEGVPLLGRDEILSYEEITALVACLQEEFGLTKVRITGGEPLVRPDIERLVAKLADLGIPDLALTTNGLHLAEMAPLLRRAGLRRVNVSLDSISHDTFRRLTGGGDLQAVLDGITTALDVGLRPLKLNTVVIRGVNDNELRDLVEFGLRRDCEVRFIELMPIGPGAPLSANGFISSEAVQRSLSSHFTFHPLGMESGESASRYSVVSAEGRRGTVGFISSCSAPFCGTCARLRVTADGRLIGCLARDGGVPIRETLRAGDRTSIAAVVRRVLSGKTADRIFEQNMAMASIGG
ncbi:MAG: GTP 3',8-cyclase MoaA [bacterium]